MNKTVLITGASSGIGKETAIEFASNGFDLVLVARREQNLSELKSEILKKNNIDILNITMDLSKNNSSEQLFQQIQNTGKQIDILINNSGFGIKGEFLDSELERNENMIILNILTLTKLTKLFGDEMKKRQSGTIINIASTAAFQPVPYLGVYSATKSYVLNFSEALAFELKKYNVNVIAICPGATQSEFAQVAGFTDSNDDNANSTLPSSSDLAKFIFEASKHKEAVKVHGFKNNLIVFLQRFLPRSLVTKIAGNQIK